MMNCTTNFYELTDQDCRRYRLTNEHLQSLPLCMDFMRLVVEGDMGCSETRWRHNGNATEGPTELAWHCERLHSYSLLFSRQHTFHPYVMHFLRMYREHPIRHLDGLPPGIHIETGASVEDAFEHFVLKLRAEAKTCRLRKRAADWQGKFDKNADRLIELMEHVIKGSKSLTVIELELDFLASRLTPEEAKEIILTDSLLMQAEYDAYWSGWSLDRVEPAAVKVPFNEIQRYRKRLFENMKGKPTLFKSLRGYVWRVRFTPVAGFSLRASLILDGAEGAQADLGQAVGRYWEESITQGRGSFRELEPWPAINIAYRISALRGTDKTEQKKLRRQLMGHLGGSLLAVQVLPHPGCNLFGTGLVHRRATMQPSKAFSPAQPTRGERGSADIQNRHSLGATDTWMPVATGGPTLVGGSASARKGGKTASDVVARRGK